MANSESVLVVDDSDEDLKIASGVLEREGFKVQKARSGDEACELLAAAPYDLVVTDLVMRGLNGFDVIKAAQKANPESIVIAMTSYGSLDSVTDALGFGAYSYLPKPCDPADLVHCVRRGLEKQRLTKELRQRNLELDSKVQEATRELQELNQRMLTEMASLKEVDTLKNVFLDNVSHDLKSPLTSVKGYLYYLLDNPSEVLPAEARDCLQKTSKAVSHMEYLINQLLEVAKLTAGKIALDWQPVSVRELVDSAEALARPLAEAAGVKLEVLHDFDPALILRADPGRLLQVLSNLLGNACKFTPKGGRIALRVRAEESGVHFTVEDTGAGIAREHQEKIFEKFYQVDSSLTRKFKGLGLGLRIVRDLVELHRGKIWVESEPGRGSKFHVLIPAA